MKHIIEFIKVTKVFSQSNFILRELSFGIKPNTVSGILGPNASGKTTILKIISTLLLPDAGTVTVNGLNIFNQDQEIKKIIGLLSSDDRSFYWRLTGRQNLLLFAQLYGIDQPRQRIKYLCQQFNIDFLDYKVGTYSSGMHRRLALARTLLHDPLIVLLDEPEKSLDKNTVSQIQDQINLMKNSGKTICIATHDQVLAKNTCDYFYLVDQAIMTKGTINQ